MKKLMILSFLFILLFCGYFFLSKEDSNLLPYENKAKSKIKNGLADGIYYLYKKCNLNKNICHELKPLKIDGNYFLDSNQEPYEERMYLYIKNDIGITYSLIYYDEDMFPTITWSKLVKDQTNPFTYMTIENHMVSGIEYHMFMNNYDFSSLEKTEIDKIKIGDSPEGSTYPLNQIISFNFEKNGDISINCEKYLSSLKKLNKDKSSAFGEVFEISCNPDSYFHNTAQYGEKRIVYFKKIE